MKTKHTKGEWVIRTSGAKPNERITNEKGSIIADLYSWSENIKDEEAKANAKLIAAAPELLDALKWLLEAVRPTNNNTVNAVNNAKNVIKKATE